MIVKRGVRCKDSVKSNSTYSNKKYSFVNIPSSKSGQVTIFIIIGILILFVFAGILFFTNNIVKEKTDAAGEPIITKVPSQFQPIQVYTENCMRRITENGLNLIGAQGGYLHPDLVGKYSELNPTDSDGLNLGSTQVPYWHYNSIPNKQNSVGYRSLKPELLESEDPGLAIEAQLSKHIKENINDCLDAYNIFKEQGFEFDYTEDTKKDIELSIGETTINVFFKTSFNVDKAGADTHFEQFFVRIPLNFKRFYDLASDIAEAEQEYQFLERQALDLVEIYSGVNADKLPPTYDLKNSKSSIFWQVDDAEKNYKEVLATNIPYLRFLGSRNNFDYEFPVSRLQDTLQANHDAMILPLDGGQGLEISFDYLGWPIYFDISGKDFVGGQELFFTNPLGIPPFSLTMQRYRNQYDISSPVLVTIRDPDALGGKGYTFTFALESNLRNNWNVSPERSDECYYATSLQEIKYIL